MTKALKEYVRVFKDKNIKILIAIILTSTTVSKVATALAVDILKLKGLREANPLYYFLGPPLFYLTTTLLIILLIMITPIAERLGRKAPYMRVHYIYLGLLALYFALDAVHDILSLLLIVSPLIKIVTDITFIILNNPLVTLTVAELYAVICMIILYMRYKRTVIQGKTRIIKFSL